MEVHQFKETINIASLNAVTLSPSANDFPTPTNLPRNQTGVTPEYVADSIIMGGLSVLLVISFLGGIF